MSARANQTGEAPLVTVIMPFLNAERYVREAVDSVIAQTYSNWELVFVNDGCTDGTRSIIEDYIARHAGRMRLVAHSDAGNHGISASRNLGIRYAGGKYLGFLDADDLWMPEKLARQVAILESQPQAAMVLGQVDYWYSWTGSPEDARRDFVPDPGIPVNQLYEAPSLLIQLYPLGQNTAPSMSDILMVKDLPERVGGFVDEFRGMYEDQAFLVKAYLSSAVYVSGECWDKYRIHPESCRSTANKSGQYETVRALFLNWFQDYLDQQKVNDPRIRGVLAEAFQRRNPKEDVHYNGWLFRVGGSNEAELVVAPEEPSKLRVEIARWDGGAPYEIQLNQPRLQFREGQAYVVAFQARAGRARQISIGAAMGHAPWDGLGLYQTLDLTPEWREFAITFTARADDDNARIHFDLGSADAAVELRDVKFSLPDGTKAPGGVNLGSLRRVTPISRMWGYDRGIPIDRYYIENFLQKHAADVRGRVMEIEDNMYTYRFGGTQVTRSDVLHVVEGNPRATIIGDLTCAPQIADNIFDCVVLTQTLQLIYDFRAAIQTLYRILKPGGVLLVTFPGISQTNDRDWSNDWYWAFTPLSAKRMFSEAFPSENVLVESQGNVLSAISFLHGLSAHELTREELSYAEPGYEVTIGVRALKDGGSA